FSGKDPTKVDRSAAYACRYLAKNVVAAGISDRCTIQIGYAIGVARPLSFYVDLGKNGEVDPARLEQILPELIGGTTPLATREAPKWQEANFPKALKAQSGYGDELSDAQAPDSDLMAWRQRIGEKGWATPTWPANYGGGGLSVKAARVLQQEMARVGAFNPLMFGMGVTMIGPTLLDYGTPE